MYGAGLVDSASDDDVAFEEVTPASRETFALVNGASAAKLDEDEDDSDAQWDEIVPSVDAPAPPVVTPRAGNKSFEIILERGPKSAISKPVAPKRKVATPEERAQRLRLHKVHTLCLLAAVRSRNEMINDDLLRARLMSKIPMKLQHNFSSINKRTTPDENDRARLFDQALKELVSWWWQCFEIDESLTAERTRTFVDVATELAAKSITDTSQLVQPETDEASPKRRKGKGKAKAMPEDLPFGPHEVVRSAQSLMKRAVTFSGTRDMSAQLFTSACRAIGVPARLVCSLQPISWRATVASTTATAVDDDVDEDEDDSDVGSSNKKRKRKTPVRKPRAKKRARKTPAYADSNVATEDDVQQDSDEDVEMEEVAVASAGSSVGRSAKRTGAGTISTPINLTDGDSTDHSVVSVKSPRVNPRIGASTKLRSTRPSKVKLDRSPSPDGDEMHVYPVYWTEVYSRSSRRWVPADVSRKLVHRREQMEPPKANKEVQMLYVVAFEDDGYARDVTLRYVKDFGTRTSKERPTTRRAGEPDWWSSVFSQLERPYALERNSFEDEELSKAVVKTSMPTTVAGFKNHPLYVLAGDMKREEQLDPRARKIGRFRDTDVYARSAVLALKAPEGWMREGRRVKIGEQPLKFVKRRVVTINRKREQELAAQDGEEPAQQGLYAERQTELAMPAPIVDGQIPRNSYGNIDIFADHMVPPGSTHLRYKGIAKIAKKLQISYAEANTGFEFRKQRAHPVLEGIVVAEDMAETVLEAFREFEQKAAERAQARLEERCLKRWKKLIEGIFVRERLSDEYGVSTGPSKKKAAAKKGKAQGDDTTPSRIEGPSQLRRVQADGEEELSSSSAPSTGKKTRAPRTPLAAAAPNNRLPRSAAEIAKAAEDEVSKRRRIRVAGGLAESSDSDAMDEDDDNDAAAAYMPHAGPSNPRTTRSSVALTNGTSTRAARTALAAEDTDSEPDSRMLRRRDPAAAKAVQEALGEASDDDAAGGSDAADGDAFVYASD